MTLFYCIHIQEITGRLASSNPGRTEVHHLDGGALPIRETALILADQQELLFRVDSRGGRSIELAELNASTATAIDPEE